jgi:hypothetical protein
MVKNVHAEERLSKKRPFVRLNIDQNSCKDGINDRRFYENWQDHTVFILQFRCFRERSLYKEGRKTVQKTVRKTVLLKKLFVKPSLKHDYI